MLAQEKQSGYRFSACGQRFDSELIEKNLPQLASVVERFIAGHWQAKVAVSDILQDTFLDATKSLPAFSGTTVAEFNVWLRSILTNNIRDVRRKYLDTRMRDASRERRLDKDRLERISSPDPSPSQAAVAVEFDMHMHRAVSALPLTDRQLLTLKLKDSLTFAEIGRRLKLKEDTVRKRWGRILVQLRRDLQTLDAGNTVIDCESCPG